MSDKLRDHMVEIKGIFPMHLFTDPHKGKHSGGKFLCFVGAAPPFKLFSPDEEIHTQALTVMRTGQWKKLALEEAAKADPHNKKNIGFGVGNTPSLAFRQACEMSGDLKLDKVVGS